MKKKVSVVVLVICLLCSAIFMASCGKPDEGKKPTPDPEKPVDTSVFTFSGDATLGGTLYNIKLIGKADKTFILKPNDTIAPIKGTYELVARKGYIFSFSDSVSTKAKTTFDAANKEFSMNYYLKISDTAKGKITLKFIDKTFDYDGIGFVNTSPTIAAFTGSGDAMDITVNFTLNLRADKTCELKTDSQYVPARTGKYTFANDIYTITLDDENAEGKVFASTKANGIYTIAYAFKGGNATITANLTLATTIAAFTGSGEAMGTTVNFTLNLKADKTCELKADFKFIAPRTGKYTFANDVYTITLDDENVEGKVFASTKTNGVHTIPYAFKGGEATITASLTFVATVATFTGSGEAMNKTVNFTLNLKEDKTCELKSDFQFIAPRTGKYTITNDVYTITLDDENAEGKVFASTKANGVYTIAYAYKGGEATITASLTYTPIA